VIENGCRVRLRPAGANPSTGPALETAVRYGVRDGIEIWYDSRLGQRGRDIAAGVLARCEPDLATISGLFGGVLPAQLPIRVTLLRTPEDSRAFHDTCRPQHAYCDVMTTPVVAPRYSAFLLAVELAEIIAGAHGQGWQPGTAHAAALSRTIAATIYPRQLAGFATATAWLDSPRSDFITDPADPDDDVAIGCAVLFLHYLHGRLGHSWADIIAAGGPTLAVAHRRLTGELGDPFPAFVSCLDERFPRGRTVQLDGDNPFPLDGVASPTVPALAGAGPAVVAESVATEVVDAPPLAAALAHRRWWVVDTPFRHLRADDVFTGEVYAALESDFVRRLDNGLLTRSLPGYDASAAAITPRNAGPFTIFLSREWHDAVAAVLGVNATGAVNVTLHHHAPGSLSGRAHNDLNPGWFPDVPIPPERTLAADPAVCHYQTGARPDGGPAVEQVRAVALIYYLATPPEVRGGQTGLYRSAQDDVSRPDVAVPPRNNCLVAFECTPFSFHSFMTNTVAARNSVVMWLHRDKAEVVRRWGAASIVRWSR
jgi:hypothetical protein